MKHRSVLPWVLLGLIGIINVALALPSAGESAPTVIQAQEFRLVDKEGKIRARLTIHPGEKKHEYFEDKPGLYLYDRYDHLLGSFRITDDTAALVLSAEGMPRAGVGVSKQQPDGHQGGYVWVLDSRDRGANLGVYQEFGKRPTSASSIRVFEGGPDKIIWQAP